MVCVGVCVCVCVCAIAERILLAGNDCVVFLDLFVLGHKLLVVCQVTRSSWVCALGIAITTMLPQRVFPIVQDCPYMESAKCV